MNKVKACDGLDQSGNLIYSSIIPLFIINIIGDGISNHHHLIAVELIVLAIAITGLAMIFPRKDKSSASEELIKLQESLIRVQEENLQLAQKVEELKKIGASKDQFLKIIAHDLKSPINSILGLHEVIKLDENASKEDTIDVLNKMVDSGTKVKFLIDNLLDWCIKNNGLITPKIEKVSVVDIMKKVELIYASLAEDKGISFIIDIPHDFHLWVDGNHLFSILRNIVNNAIKYTKTDGTITVSTEIVNEEMAMIEVCDDGEGMDQDKINELLSLGNQKSGMITSEPGTGGELGNGLGLSMSYELIHLNDGELKVKSEKGDGACFAVILPLFKEK